MDWIQSNWTGLSLTLAIVGATVGYAIREIEHKRLARFDLAMSKIYQEVQSYIEAAYRFKDSVNCLPLRKLLDREAKQIDESITETLYELECRTVMIQVFFKEDDRMVFRNILNSSVDFNSQLHLAFTCHTGEIEQISIYDKARVKFNSEFDSAIKTLTEMLHKELLGMWRPRTWWAKLTDRLRSMWHR